MLSPPVINYFFQISHRHRFKQVLFYIKVHFYYKIISVYYCWHDFSILESINQSNSQRSEDEDRYVCLVW